MTDSSASTRLSLRDLHAERVWRAMREHADEIAEPRDVLQLARLRDLNGECVAVAVADLCARGLVVGGVGTGRIRAVAKTGELG